MKQRAIEREKERGKRDTERRRLGKGADGWGEIMTKREEEGVLTAVTEKERQRLGEGEKVE